MTTVYFIRHGTTNSNINGCFQGSTDIPLSDMGLAQAAALGEKFKNIPLDAVYTSPLIRARQTADGVCKYQSAEPIVFDDLREVDGGLLENRTNEQNELDYPGSMTTLRSDPAHFVPPEGETGMQVYHRVKKAVESIVSRHDGQTIAVVSHGFALMTYLGTVDRPPEMMEARLAANASVSTVTFEKPDCPVMTDYNNTSHLPKNTRFHSKFWNEDER